MANVHRLSSARENILEKNPRPPGLSLPAGPGGDDGVGGSGSKPKGSPGGLPRGCRAGKPRPGERPSRGTEAGMGSTIRVLALHAHPDDIEFQCSGTLALLAEAGCDLTVATMTPGDCGSAEHDAEAIAEIRRGEARA